MHDVFLSYSTQDKSSADAVCHGLESQGIRCFIAPRDMMPGNWSGQITHAIKASKVFVLIFSENSNTSDAVESEVSVAVQARLHIVNFRLEAVDPSPDLELHLRKRHWLDAIKPLQKAHIDQLAVAIKKLIDPAATPPESGQREGDGKKEGGTPAPSRQWTVPRLAAVGTVIALIAGAAGWGLRKPEKEDASPRPIPSGEPTTAMPTAPIPVPVPAVATPVAPVMPEAVPWKVQVLTPEGKPIESGDPVPARRQRGATTWGDGEGRIHQAENYVQFSLQMKSAGEALPGPFWVHYTVKEGSPDGRLRMDDSIAPGVAPLTEPQWTHWRELGYTRGAAWKILERADEGPLPAATEKDQTFGFSPSLILGKEGYLAHGIHDIGIQVEDADKNIVYRGTLKLEAWETDPRDNLLEWVQEGGDSGVPSERVKTFRTTDATGKETVWESDLSYAYQIKNVSGKSLGPISSTTWFMAQKPTDPPKPGGIVATAKTAWEVGAATSPAGYTSVNYWSMGSLTLAPGEQSTVWTTYLGFGRGGWISEGAHEVGIELWSGGELAYRRFHRIQVPPGPAKPGLELLDSEGRLIQPNAVVDAEVNQEYRDVPQPAFPREVTLTLDLRYQASGIGPEHQLPQPPDGSGHIAWLIFLPEDLRPHPQARQSSEPYQLADFNGPEAPWACPNLFGLLEPGDPAPIQPLKLAFPLDPSLPQAKAGQPGLWVKTGIHRVRLLAMLRSQTLLDRYPDPEAILFQRDLTLRVSQPQPIVLEGRK